jgi:hypothetical protein
VIVGVWSIPTCMLVRVGLLMPISTLSICTFVAALATALK